jgi:hypothetical protein
MTQSALTTIFPNEHKINGYTAHQAAKSFGINYIAITPSPRASLERPKVINIADLELKPFEPTKYYRIVKLGKVCQWESME